MMPTHIEKKKKQQSNTEKYSNWGLSQVFSAGMGAYILSGAVLIVTIGCYNKYLDYRASYAECAHICKKVSSNGKLYVETASDRLMNEANIITFISEKELGYFSQKRLRRELFFPQ